MATNTAASFSTPIANGTAGPFNIGFTYLAQSEIDVTVDGVLKTLNTHYIFHSTTQISFTSGNFPTVGQSIKFQRNTDISAKKVDFVDGSVLTETDLDNNTDQILFGLQEFVDELNTNVVKRDGTQTITTNLVFEGSSDDANETTLGVVNPTADRTINLPNVSGTVVTTGDTGTISNGMIADDAVNAAKISEADLKSLSNCQTGSAASLANLTNNEVLILDGATVSTTELNTLDGVNSTLTASELNVLDGITASTTNLNQLTNKEVETSLTANSDAKIPTSKAVNDRILTVTNALGGFVAIANETSFPSTHPDPSGNAGTVVSISDAGGVVINSSGVATISNGAGSGNTVTITGFPSDLHSRTLGSGVGLQVQTTSTLHTYTYHKSLIKESDLVNFSADLDSFRSRYRVVDTTPTSNNDEGDLIFRKSDNKLLVFNGTAYQEASSVGNFHTNTLSSFNGTGGGSATFNGSAYRFNINHPPELAEQLLVSINGVIQKPNNGSSQPSEGFALSGSSIIFSAAPASGSDFFIITIGKSVDIGVVSDGTIDNAKVASDASIEGTKISPDFGSQNIVTTGTGGFSELTVTSTFPQIKLTDSNSDSDFAIENGNGNFRIKDVTHNTTRFNIGSNGTGVFSGNLDVGAGLDVTGNTTFTNGTRNLDLILATNPTTGNVGCQFRAGSGDFIGIAANGTGIGLVVDNSNKIGIGIKNPARDLSLHSGDASSIFAHFTNTDTGTTASDGCIIGLGASEDLVLNNQETGKNIIFENGGSERLRITSDGNLQLPIDNQKIQLGASQDLSIYHTGAHTYIRNSTGVLHLDNDGDVKIRASLNPNEDGIKVVKDAQVEAYYDNVKRFQTTSTGATVTTASTANSIRNITTSTSAPSGGSDGDLWFTYVA